MTTKFVEHGGWIGADTCIEEGKPWLRPAAADYIQSFLHEGSNVFEWGCGASTVWLARLGCTVTSIELDQEWTDKVRKWLNDEGLCDSVRILDFSPKNSLNLCESADFILKCLDDSYDLVLIDGRARNRCLGNARSKVKVGGMLVLDNSEREEYANGVALMDTWDGYEYGDSGWRTTVYFRLPESETERVVLPCEDA
jgi:predicted O-methyltransferase YrrM